MECPTCEKSLSTKQGVRQHHTKVHGETLPNRCCKGCEVEFYDPKSRREFCDDCNPNAGEHNGNWKDKKSTATCESCSTTFSYYSSNKNGKYCQDCVESAEGLLPENPQEKEPRVFVECRYCGQKKSVLPSQEDNKERGFYCNLNCYGRWLSENIIGSNHHQWEGGPIDYGQSWWSIRRAARERDNYECQICGQSKDELGRNPDVHHLTPVRKFDNVEEAHTMDNVVTLCRSCHRHVEVGEITPNDEDKK